MVWFAPPGGLRPVCAADARARPTAARKPFFRALERRPAGRHGEGTAGRHVGHGRPARRAVTGRQGEGTFAPFFAAGPGPASASLDRLVSLG